MKVKKLKVTSVSIVKNHDTPLGLCGYWYEPDRNERKAIDERRNALNHEKRRYSAMDMLVYRKKVENFVNDIDEVCKKHGFSISHEDGFGSFIIEAYDESNINWLRDSIGMSVARKQRELENERDSKKLKALYDWR